MVDYNDLNLNRIINKYFNKQWLQNQIETATAKGLLGNDTASSIIKNNFTNDVQSRINNAINQARSKMNFNMPNRGVMVGEGTISHNGPTSSSFNRPNGIKPNLNINTTNIKASVPAYNKIIPGITKIGKGFGGPVAWGSYLLPLWFGKNAYGAEGPGRAMLDIFSNNPLNLDEETLKKIQTYGHPIEYIKSRKNNSNETDNIVPKENITTSDNVIHLGESLPDFPIENITSENYSNPDTTTNNNEEVIKQYIDMLQNRNAPYIRALNTYLQNYPKNLNNAKRSDLYFYGANLGYGLDPRAGQKFNALQNEADVIKIIKEIQDARNAEIDYANEVAGNSAIAEDLGLPKQAAFANKNLLSAYSMRERDAIKKAISDAQIKAKKYGIDERAALMRELQNLKYKMGVDVANIYMGNDLSTVPPVGLDDNGSVKTNNKTTNKTNNKIKETDKFVLLDDNKLTGGKSIPIVKGNSMASDFANYSGRKK